jgi:hypothetical protein
MTLPRSPFDIPRTYIICFRRVGRYLFKTTTKRIYSTVINISRQNVRDVFQSLHLSQAKWNCIRTDIRCYSWIHKDKLMSDRDTITFGLAIQHSVWLIYSFS